jgi:hypothetical protein
MGESITMSAAHAESLHEPMVDRRGAAYRPGSARPAARGVAQKASYAAGFGFSFAFQLFKAMLPEPRPAEPRPNVAPEREDNDAAAPIKAAPARQRVAPTPIFAPRTLPAPVEPLRDPSVKSIFIRARDWIRDRLNKLRAKLRSFIETLSARKDGVWEYALVTVAYWGLTITDGAIRMLVLFQFYLMGYSAIQIASLFLFYEIFGVVTNLFGGWIGANFGLRFTLFSGLGIQIAALAMLALMNPAWPAWLVVGYVMVSQALSGIAKDLTKMSSKSAIKAVIPANADVKMYKWVSLLTGSKNALKGVGFFVGALLLTVTGFTMSLLIMSVGLAFLLHALWRHLPSDLGRAKEKTKFKSMFSMDRRINILSAARFFLFGARDVWFVIALPVYMSVVFGWSPMVVGAYLALWTIGYGIVQSLAPKFIAAKKGETPKGYTVYFWSMVLTAVPVAIALALGAGFFPALSLVGGLAIFGIVFAVNSAVHSYMIVHYADSEKVAMTIGFYYMANAGGRLVGTVLSGGIYQVAGIVGCLWVSAIFVGASALISSLLVLPAGRRTATALPAPRTTMLLQACSVA